MRQSDYVPPQISVVIQSLSGRCAFKNFFSFNTFSNLITFFFHFHNNSFNFANTINIFVVCIKIFSATMLQSFPRHSTSCIFVYNNQNIHPKSGSWLSFRVSFLPCQILGPQGESYGLSHKKTKQLFLLMYQLQKNIRGSIAQCYFYIVTYTHHWIILMCYSLENQQILDDKEELKIFLGFLYPLVLGPCVKYWMFSLQFSNTKDVQVYLACIRHFLNGCFRQGLYLLKVNWGKMNLVHPLLYIDKKLWLSDCGSFFLPCIFVFQLTQ